jgi:hypothetical protein
MAEEPQTEQLSEEIKTLIRGALPLRRVIRMLTGDQHSYFSRIFF